MINTLTNWHVASVQAPKMHFNPINGHRYQGWRRWRPCIEWCVKTFDGGIGATAYGPGWRFVGEGVFEFKHEQDLVLFLLRWQ